MTDLPDTTRQRPRRKAGLSAPVAGLLAVLALGVGAVLLFSGAGGAPRPSEEVYAAGVEEIAAGTGDAPFPSSDASRFDAGTRAVRVYLRVEDVPAAERMVATVERSGRSSIFSRLFRGGGVRAKGGGEGRLTVSGGGASGVVSFVVRGENGRALPAGGYGVEVRFVAGDGGSAGTLLARKYFRVGGPQT